MAWLVIVICALIAWLVFRLRSTPEGRPHPKHRQEAIKWAQDLLRDRDSWVVLDTETTGLKDTSEVIQIAVLSGRGEVLLDTLVKPAHAKRMPSRALQTHGITMTMLKGAPSFQEVMPLLEAATKGKAVVIYNAAYDTRLLVQTVAFNNVQTDLQLNCQCAMIHYSRYVGEWWEGKKDYKWQKLPGGDHSATGDCRAVIALIERMAVG